VTTGSAAAARAVRVSTLAAPRGWRDIAFLGGERKRMLLDGDWVEAADGSTFASVSPSTGEVVAHIPAGGADDANRAVAAARRALTGPWRKMTPADRQSLLWRLADLVEQNWGELAAIDSADFGGPISRTRAAGSRAVGLLRYYSGLASRIEGETITTSLPGEYFAYTVREPVGVVAAIVPWNGPIGSTLWKVGPALAAGCTVVLKPSEEASLMLLRFGEMVMAAGFPAGVFNILTGTGVAGRALAEHPDVDKVAFTGSTATGQSIIRASAVNVKRLSLELGGKSPQIVFADADLDAAAPAAAMAAFANSGQLCSAGTRLFAAREICDELTERIVDIARALRIGDSLDPESDLGPLVSQRQLDKVVGYVNAGLDAGARAVTGGARLGGELARGYFLPPTVFTGVSDDMSVAREEIFGPVLAVLPFATEDEVIERANDTRFGLACGIWTSDIGRVHRISRAVRAGTVWVNCYLAFDAAVPFGGFKESGYGRESGSRQLEEYLESKSVMIRS
jgi:aldehyde dehydrogenase (NAD+)